MILKLIETLNEILIKIIKDFESVRGLAGDLPGAHQSFYWKEAKGLFTEVWTKLRETKKPTGEANTP